MEIPTEKKMMISFTGAIGVGKTQLINSLVNGSYSTQYEPTIQETHSMKMVQGNNIFALTLVDTSGSPDYAKLVSTAIGSSDCVVVCYCPYVPKTYERVVQVVNDVREIGDDIPIIVVATKMDLKDDKNILDKIGKQKIRLTKDVKAELKKKKISAFFEISVLSGDSFKVILENCIKFTQKSSLWKKKN